MIVIDASAMVELLLATPTGERVAKWYLREGITLHAPHLIDLEVTNALRRLVRQRRIDSPRAREALGDLKSIALFRYAHDPFLDRVWDLRNNASPYDAVYLSLSEVLGVPLITCDARLRGIPGHRAAVQVL